MAKERRFSQVVISPKRATIGCSYRFSAAHQLPKVPPGHKCAFMHGHNYTIDVIIEGELDDTGFVMDFGAIDLVMGSWLKQVDHKVLNHVPGLDNPTAEIIAGWFATMLKNTFDTSVTVRVYETDDCWAQVTL